MNEGETRGSEGGPVLLSLMFTKHGSAPVIRCFIGPGLAVVCVGTYRLHLTDPPRSPNRAVDSFSRPSSF